MRQTECHGAALRLLNSGHLVQILADTTDQLVNGGRVDALEANGFKKKLFLSDLECIAEKDSSSTPSSSRRFYSKLTVTDDAAQL